MSESDTMFNERDRRCAAVQLMLSTDLSYETGPLPTPSKYKSGRFNAWGHRSTHRTTLWRWWSGRTPPGTPGTEELIEKVRAIIDETPQRPIRQIAGDLGVSHSTVNACVKKHLKCRSYRRQTSQILTEKTKNLRLIKFVRPPPPPTWTCWTTSFGHTSTTSPTWPPTTPSQPDRRHPPSIRRATAGAYGKGMLPVPDPYRGGNCGWRRLYWIDVSSTT